MIYIGLPQWSHPKWARLGITSLEEYARHFNCVEGNTTLYALPKAEIVDRWYAQTTDDFRFCFKFPATIFTRPRCAIATIWYRRFLPAWRRWKRVLANTGCSCPPPAPRDLPALWQFLDALPATFTYGVEVRHPCFLTKVRMNSGSIAGYTRAA